jgi:5-methylcytosine-specific restriction endonuclease McrA
VQQEYQAWVDARARRYQMQMNERVIAREREREQRRSDYYQYIQGSVWRRKRALVLRRCHGVCESCGEAPATQVHHTVYPENFGDEPLWDLRGVCRPCHELIHGIRP